MAASERRVACSHISSLRLWHALLARSGAWRPVPREGHSLLLLVLQNPDLIESFTTFERRAFTQLPAVVRRSGAAAGTSPDLYCAVTGVIAIDQCQFPNSRTRLLAPGFETRVSRLILWSDETLRIPSHISARLKAIDQKPANAEWTWFSPTV